MTHMFQGDYSTTSLSSPGPLPLCRAVAKVHLLFIRFLGSQASELDEGTFLGDVSFRLPLFLINYHWDVIPRSQSDDVVTFLRKTAADTEGVGRQVIDALPITQRCIQTGSQIMSVLKTSGNTWIEEACASQGRGERIEK